MLFCENDRTILQTFYKKIIYYKKTMYYDKLFYKYLM